MEVYRGNEVKLAIVVGTPLTTEWIWERNQAATDKRGLDELPYDETDSEEMLLSKKKKHRKITALKKINVLNQSTFIFFH